MKTEEPATDPCDCLVDEASREDVMVLGITRKEAEEAVRRLMKLTEQQEDELRYFSRSRARKSKVLNLPRVINPGISKVLARVLEGHVLYVDRLDRDTFIVSTYALVKVDNTLYQLYCRESFEGPPINANLDPVKPDVAMRLLEAHDVPRDVIERLLA
jgi:hypothetical protein